MFHLFVIIVVVCVLALLFAAHKYHQKKDRKSLQLLGLEHIKHLRLVLHLLQKHREISSNLIQGESSVEQEIVSIELQVNQIIDTLMQEDKTILSNELWFSVMDHWQRLSHNYVNNTVENNELQHNSMIQNLLYLIDDIAMSHELTRLKLTDVDNIRLLWKEWLTAIECIGQVRSMGSAILAEGECDSVSRIRLAYLQGKLAATNELAWRGIKVSEAHKSHLNTLDKYINNDIIHASISNNISLASKDYVSLCTDIMEHYYQQFDQKMAQL